MLRRRRGSDLHNQGAILIANALVHLDETGIEGDPVTAWRNKGTGGGSYDLTVVAGTPSNLTQDTQLGNTVVATAGGVAFEPSSGQMIDFPGTVFTVGRVSNTPTINSFFFDAKSLVGNKWALLTFNSAADRFSSVQNNVGPVITISEAFDNNPHIFTNKFNGGATNSLSVSGLGSVVGNSGSNSWEYASLFDDYDGGNSMQGYIAALIVFSFALSDIQIMAVETWLAARYPGVVT